MTTYRLYALPWDGGDPQDLLFRRWALRICAVVAVVAIVLGVVPVPTPERVVVDETPERFARLILPTPEPAPPPPPLPPREPDPPKPVEVAPVAPEPVVVAPPPPRPEPRVAEVEPEPIPEPVPVVDRAREAREEAASAGLMPLADELASLRDNAALGSVTAAEARIGTVGEATRSERALLTRDAASASGGVEVAALSRDTGGSGLAGRETTRVVSTVAGLAPVEGANVPEGLGGVPARSREEIELVFDRNKGAIYALYNRALRSNPALQGKLVVQLTIEPSGEISGVEIVSSELADTELERRLLQRIRMFRFEDRNVAPVVMTKPIDFFPA